MTRQVTGTIDTMVFKTSDRHRDKHDNQPVLSDIVAATLLTVASAWLDRVDSSCSNPVSLICCRSGPAKPETRLQHTIPLTVFEYHQMHYECCRIINVPNSVSIKSTSCAKYRSKSLVRSEMLYRTKSDFEQGNKNVLNV